MRDGREWWDLRLLLMCVGIVPSVWALLLGWDGAALLGGHDSYSFILQYRDFVRAGGDWHPPLYAPHVYGGSGLHNALPIVLFYQAWAWLGVAPVLAYNLSSFSLQIIIAFLGVRASQDLVAHWRGEECRSPIVIELSAILLFAFAPFLGWRFGSGHQGLICGILVFFGADGTRQPVALFPSYGSLTGAIVPAGDGTLVIASVATRPWWRWALYLGGGLCFLFACVLARRWRSGEGH